MRVGRPLPFSSRPIQALICAPILNSPAPAQAPTELAPSVSLRLAAINVWYRNHQFQRVIDFIARERPDFVLLAEVTAAWEQALARLNASYAHRYTTRGLRGTGLLLLSALANAGRGVARLFGYRAGGVGDDPCQRAQFAAF